jgi:hypothetical protein
MAERRRNRSLFTLNDEVAHQQDDGPKLAAACCAVAAAAIFAFAPKPAV